MSVSVSVAGVYAQCSHSNVRHVPRKKASKHRRKKEKQFSEVIFLESAECHNYIDKTNWKKMFAILFEKWCFYKPILELTHWRSALASIVSVVFPILFCLAWRSMPCHAMAWIRLVDGVTVAWLNLYHCLNWCLHLSNAVRALVCKCHTFHLIDFRP